MAINWEEAPEGTTHGTERVGVLALFYGNWRKITAKGVYYYRNGMWEERQGVDIASYIRNNPHLVAKPEVLEEAALPNGLKWPEGYTHFNTCCGGFFFNKLEWARSCHLMRKNQFEGDAFGYWLRHDQTISRYGKGVVFEQSKQEQPKKKVGWW